MNTDFNLDTLLNLPKLPKLEPKDFFLNQDFYERFRRDPKIKVDENTSITGLKVFLKANQTCGCWMISDPVISKAYLNGDINEVELTYLAISKNKNVGMITG